MGIRYVVIKNIFSTLSHIYLTKKETSKNYQMGVNIISTYFFNFHLMNTLYYNYFGIKPSYIRSKYYIKLPRDIISLSLKVNQLLYSKECCDIM